MDAHTRNPAEESVGELFTQLKEDGRTLVRAELGLYKQIAAYRASKAKNGFIAIGAAAVLGLCGVFALFVGLVLGLAELIGPVASGIVVLAVAGGVAFLLIRWGAGKLSALSGDQEEQRALKAGENRA